MIDLATAWRPHEPGLEPRTKRFFHVDDDGDAFWIVAWDLDHAKQLLRDCGVELTAEDGCSRPIDHPDVAHYEWKEISVERAAKIRCQRDDRYDSATVALSECVVGEWFSREW